MESTPTLSYKLLGSTGYSVNLPKIISLDTEYSQKQVRGATLLSVSIGVSPRLTYILDDFQMTQKFVDEADVIFMWNGVVDHYILEQNGIKFDKSKIIDAMLLEHLIDERLDHGLGDFALREYKDNYKEEFWSQYKNYQDAPKDIAYEYEMRDGCYTYSAGIKYLKTLQKSNKLKLVKHVHKLQWALFDTEISGLKVNLPLMVSTKKEMSEKIESYLPELRKEFYAYCTLLELQKWEVEIKKKSSHTGKLNVIRPSFSFASDKQISELLFGPEGLKLESKQKTKKGRPSTSFDSLKDLSESHPEISKIVEYKNIKSVYATFVAGMLERVENGRIYPGFFINGTATGRISHNNPNMGNLPTDGVIRNFFIPESGNSIIGADYSQLEVVIEANLTEDPSLLKIILEGASKHDITAEGLGITRDQAKTLNFALQYGAGVHKVSKLLSISSQEATNVFTRYWEIYSGVKKLKDETAQVLESTGEVTNIFGRTRHFSKPKNEYEKAKQERQAYNHLIQGVGADITNMSTYLISNELSARKLGRLWFSVHDEIICEVQDSLIDPSIDAIVKCMGVPNEVLNLKYHVATKPYGPLRFWAKV